jgi:hypothetical protein
MAVAALAPEAGRSTPPPPEVTVNRIRSSRCVPAPRQAADDAPPSAAPSTSSPAGRPVDLATYRARHTAVVRAAATAPVRYLPAAFLDALQGSWGDIEPIEPVRQSAARSELVPVRLRRVR